MKNLLLTVTIALISFLSVVANAHPLTSTITNRTSVSMVDDFKTKSEGYSSGYFYTFRHLNYIRTNDESEENELRMMCESYGTHSVTTCNSYTWINGVTYTSSNNTAKDTLTNQAGCDSIITLNLSINSSFTTDVVTACNSYTWIDGITYSSNNNTAKDTLTNQMGCDSIITLNLTIDTSSIFTDVVIACDSFVWIDGKTYYANNNSAKDTLVNSAGCDSIVSLDLTMNYTVHSTNTVVACNSYTFNGITYTSNNNTAKDTFPTTNGCGMIVTLDLTIINLTTSTDVVSACDSFTWINGVTYTTNNNTAKDTLVNAAGCDSIITLDLTINHPNSGVDVITACDTYTWINGVTYTSNNNSDIYYLTNSGGCDSVVTLNLTIKQSSFSTDTVIACDNFTWINGITYTSSNSSATYTFTNAVGCDSIVSLDLTINNSYYSTEVITACDSFTWINGVTYTASNNTDSVIFANSIGCDSVVKLDLTIYNPTTATDVVFACDSFTWINGVTYTSNNNTAIDTLMNSHGCDSIVSLNLTVVNFINTTDFVTACDSYTWIDGLTYTTNNNTATDTIFNAFGCDTIINLHLIITHSNSSTDVVTACNSYVWIDGVTYTSSNNSATHTLTNAEGCDSIVSLDLTINHSTSSTYAVTVCNSFTWINGVTYTSSNNTATHTLTNAVGCDSIITLDLTVTQTTYSTQVVSACNSYTWINGVTYTSSNNTATRTFTNASGCDSIVTLNLTINHPTSSTDVVTACNSYTWIDGVTYVSSYNSAFHTLTNAAGCDSVVSLNLTIRYSIYSTDVISACGSYTWINGVTYTASNNSATKTYTTATGCDSIVILNLTINNATSSTDVVSACGSYTWIDGVTYTANNNTATKTLTSAAGCDSVVTLNLTINNSTTATDVITACDSYTWIDGVTYIASNNIATHTLTNAAGCDSMITLDLTITNSSNSTDVIFACNSYTWINGVTYIASNNSATHTLTNAIGCDSVITLDLTISNSASSTDMVTACDSYTWIDGITYTSNNNSSTHTLTTSAGCDSVVTLDLTITHSTSSTYAVTACDSYTWVDGVTYTASNNTATHTLTNAVGCDSIVTLDLTINKSTAIIDAISTCSSYTWIDGVTYTSSTNSATYITTNSVGCDSIITLNLTINNSTPSTDNVIACNSYTWIDGVTYTSSNNTATHTLINSVGCDSVVTLDLTIVAPTTSTDVVSACRNYTWIDGITYTSNNNTATYNLTNAAGCDSVVTLDLTINNSTSSTDVVTTCNSYTWIDGVTYTASNNSATHTLTNAMGCDSVITLDLTISNSSSTTVMSTCNSYTWIDGVTYTSSNNTATHTLTNASGCDSIVSLDLIINNSSSTDVRSACNSFTWINGMTYTASNNTATHTLVNAAGCDSVVTLNLTIKNSTSYIDVVSTCNNYTWINGITYTTSNNSATHTLTNAAGCDSVVSLDLTINSSTSSSDVKTACNSYTWINGVTYTSSNNTATHTLTNSLGCDSVVSLYLTILNKGTGVDAQVHCGSYTWIDGITYTTSTNSPTWTIAGASSNGCDSIVTLDLTINTIIYDTLVVYRCDSYTVPQTGSVYTTSGVYSDSVLTSNGCYRYYVTDLTINSVTAGTISFNSGKLTITASGDNYRWLDCDNGFAPLTLGDTSRTYTPNRKGNYACMVYTNQGCIDTSACYAVNILGVTTVSNVLEWTVYPNPASSQVKLKINGGDQPGSVKFYNAVGQLVHEEKKGSGQTEIEINVSQFAEGMYTVVVNSGNLFSSKKLIIHR